MSVEVKTTPLETSIIAAKLVITHFDEIYMKMRNYDKSKVGHYFIGSHLPRCMRAKSKELGDYTIHIEEIFGNDRNIFDRPVSMAEKIIDVLLDMDSQSTIDFVEVWEQIHKTASR